jgi:hypothetical protein
MPKLKIALIIVALLSAAPAYADAAAPVSPDGVYSYTLKQNGGVLGNSTVTVRRSADGVHFRESQTLTTPLGPVDAQADEAVDGNNYAPLTWVATYTASGASHSFRLGISGSRAIQNVDGASRVPLVQQPGTQGITILDQALVSGFMVLPAQVAAGKAGVLTMLVPSANLALALRIDAGAAPAKPANAAAGDISLSVMSPLPLTVWYDPKTLIVDVIDVPSQSLVITLTKRSQTS